MWVSASHDGEDWVAWSKHNSMEPTGSLSMSWTGSSAKCSSYSLSDFSLSRAFMWALIIASSNANPTSPFTMTAGRYLSVRVV